MSLLFAVTACEACWHLLDWLGSCIAVFIFSWGGIGRRVLWEDTLSTSSRMPFLVSCSMKYCVLLACLSQSVFFIIHMCNFLHWVLLQTCPCVQPPQKRRNGRNRRLVAGRQRGWWAVTFIKMPLRYYKFLSLITPLIKPQMREPAPTPFSLSQPCLRCSPFLCPPSQTGLFKSYTGCICISLSLSFTLWSLFFFSPALSF